MKQWQLQDGQNGGFSRLKLIETEKPQAQHGEVVIRVHAASLNYRDLLFANGTAPADHGRVPLSDGAGEIVELGQGVNGWKIGDRVCGTFFRDWTGGRFDLKYHDAALGGSCDGMLAEYVVLPAHALVEIPTDYSYAQAATLPCAGLTAWYSLVTRGEMIPGDTVLLEGTGGVSIWGLQIARTSGARVVITSSSDVKLLRAISLGADVTINYKTHPEWEKEVWRITDKRGADHILDVGGPDTLGKAVNCVAAGGHIAQIGVLTGFGAPDASLFPLAARNARLSGIYVGSRAAFEEFVRFLNVTKIQPVIDRTFSFEDASAAYEHLAGGSHFGKVVIDCTA